MLGHVITGLLLLGLIILFFEVVLSQREIDVTVQELVG